MAVIAYKKFWTEFIDIYHSLPCLWDSKDENYNNRESRQLARNKLLEKLQEIDADANHDTVKRKIITFRASFNREVRKMRQAQMKRPPKVHNPNLWYFDNLSFLLNQEKQSSNDVSIDGHYDEDMTTWMGLTITKSEMAENETMDAESIGQEDVTDEDQNSHYEKVARNKSMSRLGIKSKEQKSYKIMANEEIAYRKFCTEFFDIYHSLPCLWNSNDDNYNNRESRELARNKLVEKLKEIEPDANHDTVKRKIVTFRASFNREVRKMRQAQMKQPPEEYNPRLWYFDNLSFLLNQEKQNNNDESIDGNYDEDMTMWMGQTIAKSEMAENEIMDAESISQEDVTDDDQNSHYEKVERTKLMSRLDIKNKEQDPPIDPLQTRSQDACCNRHQFGNDVVSSKLTDEAAICAQYWACDFRKLSPQQRFFAKKAIGEILILGQLNALKLNTVPTNANSLEGTSD